MHDFICGTKWEAMWNVQLTLLVGPCSFASVHRINNQEQSGLLIFIFCYKFRLCLLWLENGNQFSKIMIIALIKVKKCTMW